VIHNTSKQRLWIAMRQPEGSLLGENPLINVVNLSRHYPIIPTGNNSKNLIKHLTSTPKNVAAQLIINFDCEAEK